jgi:polyisoprenoid-binding protein YceI
LSHIRGEVSRFHGIIHLDTAAPTRSTVELVIDAGSLETGDPARDAHIRSVEFLDAEHFPEIRFCSRQVSAMRAGLYLLTGDLTIRNVCREVRLEIEDRGAAGGSPTGASGPFAAHAVIDRRDFGLRWNQDLDTGGVVVGDKIDIQIALVVASPVRWRAANGREMTTGGAR